MALKIKKASGRKVGSVVGSENLSLNDKLNAVLTKMQGTMGQESIMIATQSQANNIPKISSGILGLDIALGGGVPTGRVIEIYGPEASGKTTLALKHAAEVQKSGKLVALVDAEHAIDLQYAKKLLGVDTDQLLLSQPECGEDALDIVDKLCDMPEIGLVIVDSVAALIPRAELEGEMDDQQMGLQARMLGKGLRKVIAKANKNKVSIIFINQLREKLNVRYGSPETTPGGNALKFFSSVRLDIRRIQTLKKGEDPVGTRVKVTVKKNKIAPPGVKYEYDMYFTTGPDIACELVDLGVKHGFVKQAGAWFSLENGEKLGQGKEKAILAVKENLELQEELKNKVMGIEGYGAVLEDSLIEDESK